MALELARDIGEITCVDISDYAVEYLKRRTLSLGLDNVTAVKNAGMDLIGC